MAADITIVMYHYVRDLERSSHPRIKALDLDAFRAQLDHLQRRHCIVGYEQVRRHCLGGVPLPPQACWLTFDDGYTDHHRFVLPELRRRGLVGSFFPPARAIQEREALPVNMIHYVLASAPSEDSLLADMRGAMEAAHEAGELAEPFQAYWAQWAHAGRYDGAAVMFVKRMLQHVLPEALRLRITEGLFRKHVSGDLRGFSDALYMSTDQLSDLLDAGMHVGSHGYAHVWLNQSSVAEQAIDIDRSLAFLDRIGARPGGDWVMCYPYGGYDDHTLGLVRERGCLIGLTTVAAVADLNAHGLLELPRLDTNDLPQA